MVSFAGDLDGIRERKLRVYFRADADPTEYEGETLAVSPTQLILSSSVSLRDGARLILRVHLPVEDARGSFTEVSFSGLVLSGSKLSHGPFGYLVKIEEHTPRRKAPHS